MRRITEFQLVDHEINSEPYFYGIGVAFGSEMTHAATGIGDNPFEAIDDCLDLIARTGVDTAGMLARILAKLDLKALPVNPTKCWGCENPDDCDICDVHYYYSILYTVEN